MTTIILPRYVGTREKAQEIISSVDLSTAGSSSVDIAARAVKTATSSFVNELVKLLAGSGITKVNLLGASESFKEKLEDEGAARNIDVFTCVLA